MISSTMRPQPLNCWTDRAKFVVRLAEDESRRVGDAYVGTEHLFLGILREGTGVAAHAIRQIAGDLALIEAEFHKRLIHQGDKPPPGPLPFTPRALRALENAHEEAAQLGHRFVGTEHVLLSCLSDIDGIVPAFFEWLGFDRSAVRAQVYITLGIDPAMVKRQAREFTTPPSLNPYEPPRSSGPHIFRDTRISGRSHDMIAIVITAILAALFILVGVPLLFSSWSLR